MFLLRMQTILFVSETTKIIIGLTRIAIEMAMETPHNYDKYFK